MMDTVKELRISREVLHTPTFSRSQTPKLDLYIDAYVPALKRDAFRTTYMRMCAVLDAAQPDIMLNAVVSGMGTRFYLAFTDGPILRYLLLDEAVQQHMDLTLK